MTTRLNSAQPPRRRAPYKSILCPRTLAAAAVAFAATYGLHLETLAVRSAESDSQPDSLLPRLFSNMKVFGPIYSLDAAFWDDMCRLAEFALTHAMCIPAKRDVLAYHWQQQPQQQQQQGNGSGNGQRQGAQQDHGTGPHWTWCKVTLARCRRTNVHHHDTDADSNADGYANKDRDKDED